jgi:succinyl-CoA synthetase alpha subunit
MAASTYASTIRSLAVGKDTKCIVQGFTGKSVRRKRRERKCLECFTENKDCLHPDIQSTFHSKLSLSVGTNIVGGVSPGKGGTVHLDRPVFNTVREVN